MTLLDSEQAAFRVGLAKATLAKLRVFGGGPAYRKLGGKVLYDEADLSTWIEASTRRRSTSDTVGDDAGV